MATARLLASTYQLSNTSYLNISNAANMYTDTDSTTYAQVNHTRNQTTAYYIYIRGFSFSEIPSNATITSAIVKVKALESGASTATPALYNNTTSLSKNLSGTIGTSVQTRTVDITSNWDTYKNYGNNFGIRLRLNRSSRNTASYLRIYGAEITVEYTVPVEYSITATTDSSSTISPSGSTTVFEDDSYTLTITPKDGYDITVKDNNVDVTNSLIASGSSFKYTISNISGNHTISVTGTRLVIYSVNVSCTNGTSEQSGSNSVYEGNPITITASPNSGCYFSSMTVGGASVTPTEVPMSGIDDLISLFHLNSALDDETKNSSISNTGTFSTTSVKFGSHSVFLNGNQYIQINLPQNYSPVTVECWFNVTQTNSSGKYPTLFSTNTTNSSGGTYMHIDDGAYSTKCVCRSNSTSGSTNTGGYGSTVVSRNTWHHFAYCRNGSTHYYFIDGNLEYTVTQSNPNDASTLYFGALKTSSGFNSSCYMTGYVDEILITSSCKWTSSFTAPNQEYDAALTYLYTYTIQSVDANTDVDIIFARNAETILTKENGNWKSWSKVYKKINGTWVLQENIANVFEANINYVKG